jgi:hypothetical protein
MDQSRGRGWRFRRVVPLALAGAGVCAALASGGAMVDGGRARPVPERPLTPDQLATGSLPVDVPAPLAPAAADSALRGLRASDRRMVPGTAMTAIRRASTGTTLPVHRPSGLAP